MKNGAPRYEDLLASTRVRERTLFLPLRTPNELELQARWFAGDFGKNFASATGDKIDIVQFGTWNRESGPDFSDAAIRVNGSEPVRGCIEIDPATLPEAFSANIPLARPGRCQAPLGNLPDDRVRSVLDAAAQFRLQKKAGRIRAKIDNHGRDEALFQEIAAALGYKENKLPLTLIAQRLSLKTLRKDLDDAEAMLFGVAGFLETPDLAVYKKSAKNYVRELWDRWWPHRDELQRLILPAKVWKLSSTRPVNHPQRRLAALSILVHQWPAFRRSSGKRNAKAVENFFDALDHPFWQSHYTLTAFASPEPMALVGKSRVAEILANVVFPFWRAEDVVLVVILIIGILVGFSFPAFQGVLERAKKVQAKNDLTQIVTAVNAYYTEYGKYPIDSTAAGYVPTDTTYGGTGATYTNANLFDVLRYNTASTTTAAGGGNLVTTLNPRGIVFIQPSVVRNTSRPMLGVVPNGSTGAGNWYDPWGSQYNIRIDGDYNNQLANPYTDAPGGTPLNIGVITWAFGKNGILGGGASTNSTPPNASESGSNGVFSRSGDVTSWQ